MSLSRTVSEINGDFSRKSQNFPTTHVFCAPAEWVPLGNGYRRHGVKKLEWWGNWAEKDVWRYLQLSGYNASTWQTDGRTDTGRQRRPRLSIASCGKNEVTVINVSFVLRHQNAWWTILTISKLQILGMFALIPPAGGSATASPQRVPPPVLHSQLHPLV